MGGGVHAILPLLVRRFYGLFLNLTGWEASCYFLFSSFLSSLRRFLLYPAFREGDGLNIRSAGRHDAGFGTSKHPSHRLGTVMLGMFVGRGASRSTRPTNGGKRYITRLGNATKATF
jgi:hypothetical protein